MKALRYFLGFTSVQKKTEFPDKSWNRHITGIFRPENILYVVYYLGSATAWMIYKANNIKLQIKIGYSAVSWNLRFNFWCVFWAAAYNWVSSPATFWRIQVCWWFLRCWTHGGMLPPRALSSCYLRGTPERVTGEQTGKFMKQKRQINSVGWQNTRVWEQQNKQSPCQSLLQHRILSLQRIRQKKKKRRRRRRRRRWWWWWWYTPLRFSNIPPSHTCRILVSFDSRYGICFVPVTRAAIHFPRAVSDMLIFMAWGGGGKRGKVVLNTGRMDIQPGLHFGSKKSDKILIFIEDLSEIQSFFERSEALHSKSLLCYYTYNKHIWYDIWFANWIVCLPPPPGEFVRWRQSFQLSPIQRDPQDSTALNCIVRPPSSFWQSGGGGE